MRRLRGSVLAVEAMVISISAQRIEAEGLQKCNGMEGMRVYIHTQSWQRVCSEAETRLDSGGRRLQDLANGFLDWSPLW